MITKLKKFMTALLWDEDKSVRMISTFLVGVGIIVLMGGVVTIPGMGDVVIPGVAPYYKWGGLIILAGNYIGGGGKLPTVTDVKVTQPVDVLVVPTPPKP